MSDNYDGRPGPPLWLGLVAMFVLPVFVFMAYGFTLVKAVDIRNLITIPNGTSTALPADHMFVVLAPDRGRDIGSCTVTEPTGQQAVQQARPGSAAAAAALRPQLAGSHRRDH
ncbi:MAG: hypothetical protein R2731_12655 [Nocardioides sp.]